MSKQTRQVYEFDNFRLDARKRSLLRDGEPVMLPSKAFDLLLVLIENRDRLVEKEELYQRVWAEQVVEESNLTVQMSAIRRALGERKQNPRYIVTVPGHGYRFVADIASSDDEEVVIETQTVSRVVIEREEEADDLHHLNVPALPPALEANAERTDLAALPAAPVLKLSKPSLFSYKAIALFVAAAVVLIGGAGTLWLYQAWKQNRSAATSFLPKPMTMRRFTTHGGYPFRVTISPDGKSLVYLQRFNGKESMWLGQIETNSNVPIYQRPDLEWVNPTFAPDGSKIYFMVGGDNRPKVMLAHMPVIGGPVTELISKVDSPVTCSPEGKSLAFMRHDAATRQTSIITADAADGRNERILFTTRAPASIASEGLSWSPDGKSIAFGARTAGGPDEILAVNVVDGSANKIGGGDWSRIHNLVWQPDGSGLLVVATANVGERLRQIWLVTYPGGAARKITNDLNSFLQSFISVSADGKLAVLQGHIAEIWIAPRGDATQARRVLQGVAPRYEGIDGLAWAPDLRLLYTAYVGRSEVIWSMNGDGGDLRQLTPNKENASDSNMSVTADGRYVVFQSNRSGSGEIWRVNTDGSDLRQLTTSDNNSQPNLSPDGRWIVFTSVRDGKSGLWRMTIDGSEEKQLTDKPVSFPQISPDSKYIAYIGPSEAPGTRLMIIPFEGGEPVKSFAVPRNGLRGRRAMQWMPDGKAIIYKDDIYGLWRQTLDEEKPQPMKGFEELTVRRLAWSFDGMNLAYTSGTTTQEIILIENFK